MSIKIILALFINDLNSYLKENLFYKINMIFILFFSFPVFFFWPTGNNLNFFKPERLDVGVPLIFLLGIVFLSILFSVEIFNFKKVISFKGWLDEKNNLNYKEVFWGKVLSYWFQIIFLMIQTIPIFLLYIFYSIFTFKTVLYYYGIGLIASFSFVYLGITGNIISVSEDIKDVILFSFSVIYFIGLFYTSFVIINGVGINFYYHLVWLGFTWFIIILFKFFVNKRNY